MIIITCGNEKMFSEVVLVFKSLFENMRYKNVKIINKINGNEKIDCENKDVFIIQGRFLNLKIFNYKRKFAYFVEQPDRFKKFKGYLNTFDHIFFIFKKSYNEHEKENKSFLPFGYHKLLEDNIEEKEEYDLFFFGGMNELRENIMKKDEIYYKKNCWNEKRDKEILKSKINVIIGPRKNYHLPSIHLMLILCKKKFVAIKNIPYFDPFIENLHFISYTNKEDLNYWLENEKERKEFAINAYNHVKENFHMKDIFEKEWKKINT